jgi:hypothetical protein
MTSHQSILTANGFGHGSLTIAEAWVLYVARYPVPPYMRLSSSEGWKMAVKRIGIMPAPTPGMYGSLA